MRSGASIDVCLAPYPIATHHTGVFSDKGWDITQPSSGSSIEINKMRLSVEWVYIFPVQPFNINLPRGQQRSFCLSQFSPLSGDPTCLAFMLIFLFQCSWSVTWNKHADKEILFFSPSYSWSACLIQVSSSKSTETRSADSQASIISRRRSANTFILPLHLLLVGLRLWELPCLCNDSQVMDKIVLFTWCCTWRVCSERIVSLFLLPI